MKRRLSAAVAVLALAAAACGAAESSRPPVAAKHLVAANVAMARPAAHLDFDPPATGIRQFGFALAQRLAANAANGNLVFSPASLAIAFSMLREGTTGETSAAIDRVLHLRLTATRRTTGWFVPSKTQGGATSSTSATDCSSTPPSQSISRTFPPSSGGTAPVSTPSPSPAPRSARSTPTSTPLPTGVSRT